MLSGPSGVGKGTVVAEVRRRHPDVWVSVSVTTRRPRPGERDGEHYHFVDDAEFDRLIATDGLLEWAEYAGNRYGTPVGPAAAAAGHRRSPPCWRSSCRARARCGSATPRRSWSSWPRRPGPRWSAGWPVAGRSRRPCRSGGCALAQAELDASGEFDVVVVNDDVARAADELVGLLTAPSPGLVPGE